MKKPLEVPPQDNNPHQPETPEKPATNGGQAPDSEDAPSRKHWNAESLRIDPATQATPGAKPLLVRVPVDKPNKQDFIRISPDPDRRLVAYILKLETTREIYIVAPPIAPFVKKELRLVELRVCVNTGGAVRLWPVPVPQPDDRPNAFNESQRATAEAAEKRWVRMWADMTIGQYVAEEAEDDLLPPKFPEQSLDELIEIGFKGRIIDSIDHPVLKALRGKL